MLQSSGITGTQLCLSFALRWSWKQGNLVTWVGTRYREGSLTVLSLRCNQGGVRQLASWPAGRKAGKGKPRVTSSATPPPSSSFICPPPFVVSAETVFCTQKIEASSLHLVGDCSPPRRKGLTCTWVYFNSVPIFLNHLLRTSPSVGLALILGELSASRSIRVKVFEVCFDC